VADIMMACVLRGIRKTDLMEPFPRLKAYYERCQARPAWRRTLGLYAERLGVNVDDIRIERKFSSRRGGAGSARNCERAPAATVCSPGRLSTTPQFEVFPLRPEQDS
jgi:hypothetical protein